MQMLRALWRALRSVDLVLENAAAQIVQYIQHSAGEYNVVQCSAVQQALGCFRFPLVGFCIVVPIACWWFLSCLIEGLYFLFCFVLLEAHCHILPFPFLPNTTTT